MQREAAAMAAQLDLVQHDSAALRNELEQSKARTVRALLPPCSLVCCCELCGALA
jgi:hypothetical protein